jgi:hypothetical protein
MKPKAAHFPLTSEEAQRFRERLKPAPSGSGCQEWQGCSLPKGYGKVRVRGCGFLTHRLAFFLGSGIDPGELCVLHRCDNPRCCNPEHLFLGTVADNNADMKRKGRQARGEKLPQCKFSDATVLQLRRVEPDLGIPRSQLAQIFGISPSHVSALLRRRFRTLQVPAEAPTNCSLSALSNRGDPNTDSRDLLPTCL